jgi:low temperature requirement protein LtrA
MTEPKIVTTAVIISLVAGILIILGSVYPTFGGTWTILGVVSGIIVLFSAIMLRIRPGESTQGLRMCCIAWGSMILVFSIVSLFGVYMGGFVVAIGGAVLGIVGAALALIAKV